MKLKVTIACSVIGILFILGFTLVNIAGEKNSFATALAPSAQRSHPARGSFSVSDTVYDFGVISMKNGNVNTEFTIQNLTDKEITIKTIVTSCMCTSAYIVGLDETVKGPFGMPGHGGAVPPANEIVKVGESRVIKVVYDPNAHGPAGLGSIDRFVTLTNSDGQELTLEIKAIVKP
ncbi:MAG: hypothetical protein A2849_02125 [Candidatus Taylorbacteria bacterium RIFCSPHIGHO2_01_FULL_51_15]|uniref:DUF1573 domain-containing protein n=1 Tax=Candidatus Taylorbacteria bacterium RIFCSPHIGHO2_01_FULL_51_15 TaxID=1802304 RepID=A0A1G2MCP2_9BACT|nr:MAG: hypothetical protein A2849_02125 [Candidatus Taylorbacteria bacterium RIFCSPHIGHO2_01_FULL_51_15]